MLLLSKKHRWWHKEWIPLRNAVWAIQQAGSVFCTVLSSLPDKGGQRKWICACKQEDSEMGTHVLHSWQNYNIDSLLSMTQYKAPLSLWPYGFIFLMSSWKTERVPWIWTLRHKKCEEQKADKERTWSSKLKRKRSPNRSSALENWNSNIDEIVED